MTTKSGRSKYGVQRLGNICNQRSFPKTALRLLKPEEVLCRAFRRHFG